MHNLDLIKYRKNNFFLKIFDIINKENFKSESEKNFLVFLTLAFSSFVMLGIFCIMFASNHSTENQTVNFYLYILGSIILLGSIALITVSPIYRKCSEKEIKNLFYNMNKNKINKQLHKEVENLINIQGFLLLGQKNKILKKIGK